MTEFRFTDENDIKSTSLKRFDELRKELVLHSATVFNEKNVNPTNCIEILMNLMFLINQGETFTKQERENLFFATTKLFHSNHTQMRRMIFLFLQHLQFDEAFSFILTGTLINEINKSDAYLKPNAFRLIGQIIDGSNIASIERLLKTAISSNNQEISSSAILCTFYMSLKGLNIAKPWISEITNTLNNSISQTNLLTFHTLLLIREIKENDKLYLMKTYLNLCQNNVKSQFANCQLIRYIVDLLKRGEVEDPKTQSGFYTYLENCLFKQKQEAVTLEAARGLLEIPKLKENLAINSLETMKTLLASTNKVIKYAALKTLDNSATKYGHVVKMDIFLDLEKIIDDNIYNASIKALALSIFLKISKGLSDYRLEKMFKTFTEQYANFNEEFKKDIVTISKEICKDNPSKHKLYFNFFANLIRLEACQNVKQEILDGIIWFINNDKDLKISAVLCLAEYIEDCQYDNLKTKILHVLGKEGPSANAPSQLIRYIYNRIILENAIVRAAAISSLGEIAYKDTNMRRNILNLIRRSLHDPDNEVRERAFFYVKALSDLEEQKDESAIKNYVFSTKTFDVDIIQNIMKIQKETLLNSKDIALELSSILKDPERVTKILKSSKEEQKKPDTKPKQPIKQEKKQENQEDVSGDEYKKTVFFKVYGQPKLVSKLNKLTDQYAEYNISYRKIIYDNVVILNFEIINTLEDNFLKNVSLELMDISETNGFDLGKSEIIEIDQLKFNQMRHLFFKLSKKEDEALASCNFNILLKYEVQEIDAKGNPHGNPYRDQYKVDKKVEIKFSDYFISNPKVHLNNFEEFWKLSEKTDLSYLEEKLQLPYNNIKIAGKSISDLFGFESLNDLEKVDINTKKYEFYYAVTTYYESLAFVRLQVIFVSNQDAKCLARILIRSQDEDISHMIINTLLKG